MNRQLKQYTSGVLTEERKSSRDRTPTRRVHCHTRHLIKDPAYKVSKRHSLFRCYLVSPAFQVPLNTIPPGAPYAYIFLSFSLFVLHPVERKACRWRVSQRDARHRERIRVDGHFFRGGAHHGPVTSRCRGNLSFLSVTIQFSYLREAPRDATERLTQWSRSQ